MIGTAPKPENLILTTRLLRKIRRNCYYEVLDDGLDVLEPSVWGKTNNPWQWWSLNDYEILSTTFWHEVKAFVVYLPYLPREKLKPKPATPQKSVNLQQAILRLLLPKKLRNMTFPEASLISSITSSTRLGAMISTALATLKDSSKEQYPPQQSWNISKADYDNHFNEMRLFQGNN